MKTFIKSYLEESINTKEKVLSDEKLLSLIEDIAKKIIEAYKKGQKVIFAGNGGSAADAQHLAAELVSKFFMERESLNAIALTTNTSILTSVGNDYSNDYIFSRQIQAYGNEGDIFIAISTSGNSVNIINALKEAKSRKLYTVSLTGEKPASADKFSDIVIKIPSEKTPVIQESQITIGHIICALVESGLFSEE